MFDIPNSTDMKRGVGSEKAGSSAILLTSIKVWWRNGESAAIGQCDAAAAKALGLTFHEPIVTMRLR